MAAVLPLLGCPFQSATPLGALADATIDERLVGAWRCVSPEEEKAILVTFQSLDGKQYVITIDDPGDGPQRYKAFATQVAGTAILNVQEMESAKPSPSPLWNLASYTLHTPKILEIGVVREEPFKDVPQTQEALTQALRTALREGRASDDLCLCAKVPKKSS